MSFFIFNLFSAANIYPSYFVAHFTIFQFSHYTLLVFLTIKCGNSGMHAYRKIHVSLALLHFHDGQTSKILVQVFRVLTLLY
jgi:hypothetical protein